MLNKNQAKKRIEELRAQTEYYANKYYNENILNLYQKIHLLNM